MKDFVFPSDDGSQPSHPLLTKSSTLNSDIEKQPSPIYRQPSRSRHLLFAFFYFSILLPLIGVPIYLINYGSSILNSRPVYATLSVLEIDGTISNVTAQIPRFVPPLSSLSFPNSGKGLLRQEDGAKADAVQVFNSNSSLTAQVAIVLDFACPTSVDNIDQFKDTLLIDEAEDTSTFANVHGKLAVVPKGGCSFFHKTLFLQQHGAVGVLLWNNEESFLPPVPEKSVVKQISSSNGLINIPAAVVAKSSYDMIRRITEDSGRKNIDLKVQLGPVASLQPQNYSYTYDNFLAFVMMFSGVILAILWMFKLKSSVKWFSKGYKSLEGKTKFVD